ncbi:MAG: hypothetical protein AUJ11_00510 [Parcubacteria group bacterium CG1_02_44_65]|nr:MAG: hypothetical protein AUJ11_00510 [Parcubacteria group bacterium CG1_02_44_65]
MGKANIILIRYLKMLKGVCAKKSGAGNIPALRLSAILTTREQKMWWWIKRKRKFYAKHLSYTRKAIHGLKMFLTFWRNKA